MTSVPKRSASWTPLLFKMSTCCHNFVSLAPPEVVILLYKLSNTILPFYRNFKFLSISFHWNTFSFSKNTIKVHTNHQTKKYSSKCNRFFSKAIIRKFFIPHYILIFFYVSAKEMNLWLFRNNDCLNSLNPSLVTFKRWRQWVWITIV